MNFLYALQNKYSVRAEVEKPKVVGKMTFKDLDKLNYPKDIGAAGNGVEIGNGFVLVNHSNLMFALYKKGKVRLLDTRRKTVPLSKIIENTMKYF